MGKGKARHAKKTAKKYDEDTLLFSAFCRSVGPGGTSITLYPGLEERTARVVWENENCPYEWEGVEIDPLTQAASNGHNVNVLTEEDLRPMVEWLVANKRIGTCTKCGTFGLFQGKTLCPGCSEDRHASRTEKLLSSNIGKK